jgi:hypothetical protein
VHVGHSRSVFGREVFCGLVLVLSVGRYFTYLIRSMSVPEKILLRKLKKREHKKLKFLKEKAQTEQTCG